MSARTSPARRAAFLRALAATGNQTISAERAKVSRSWVCLHRSRDPAFDAACREAIAKAQARFRSNPPLGGRGDWDGSRRPPPGWGFANGEELVVSGSNGRRTQIRRARLKQWTPRVEERFLSALAACCNAKAALAAVGMSHSSAYAHRHRWPAFARAWDDAIAIGCARLDLAIFQNIDHAFDPECPPPELDLGPVTISDLIRTLRMHEKRR